MSDQQIRDAHGKLLGTIKVRSGKYEIRDAQNCLKGTYDPGRNETHDERNKLIGKGNLLTTLL
jgi:hypothetical protein